MATYSTNEFKAGLKFIYESKPCVILENEFVQPGKGQAFNRVKFRNLITGKILEKTFKSSEKVYVANVMELTMQYIFNDAENYNFMNLDNFEQYTVSKETLADTLKWIKEQEMYNIILWNNQIISVEPPKQISLTVIETDPGIKGDTAIGGTKPAKLTTNVLVNVPLFIEEGEVIIVNTQTGQYISRAK